MQVSILGLLLCKPVHRLIGYYPFTGGGGSKMNQPERTGIAPAWKLHSELWRKTLPGRVFNHQILEMFISLQNFSPLKPPILILCTFRKNYMPFSFRITCKQLITDNV